MKNTMRTSGARGLIRALLLGAAASVTVMAAACILCALLIKNQIVPEEGSRILAVAICVLGTIPGCMAAQSLLGRARLPVSLGTCALTLALLALIRALMRTGSAAAWHPALAASLCAVGCAFAGAGRGR